MDQLTINFDYDPCARKSRNNPQSHAAHERVKHTKEDAYKWLMGLIEAEGASGITSKEIKSKTGVDLHKFSGRLSELKAMSWIYETGERRDGAAVLRVKARAEV